MLQKASTDLLKGMIKDAKLEVEQMGMAADTKQKEIAALKAHLQHLPQQAQDIAFLKVS